MELIDFAIAELSQFVANSLPPGALNSLVVDGIIAGLGGIVIFIPQIAFSICFHSYFGRYRLYVKSKLYY